MMLLDSSVCGLFKWRQFEPEVILLAVGWYLRFSLSYRDVEELLAERGLHADHVTVWRWVQRYAPEMERRLRSRLNSTNDSWRVDETYIRVKGKWVYLYRAVDSTGATIDFLLSAKRDAATAERFLGKALGRTNHPAPRVINTDEHAGYPSAIVQLKTEGALEKNCRHRPVQYLNNVLEQDHRAIKCRVRASQHFRSFWGAWRTIAGYEAIHMLRSGTLGLCVSCAKVGLLHRFILGLFAATYLNFQLSTPSLARPKSCNTSFRLHERRAKSALTPRPSPPRQFCK
jgi:transposase, IS6 family